MNKRNNQGFAISSVLYSILAVFLVLLFSILGILGGRKATLDKIKQDVLEEINGPIDETAYPTGIVGQSLLMWFDGTDAPITTLSTNLSEILDYTPYQAIINNVLLWQDKTGSSFDLIVDYNTSETSVYDEKEEAYSLTSGFLFAGSEDPFALQALTIQVIYQLTEIPDYEGEVIDLPIVGYGAIMINTSNRNNLIYGFGLEVSNNGCQIYTQYTTSEGVKRYYYDQPCNLDTYYSLTTTVDRDTGLVMSYFGDQAVLLNESFAGFSYDYNDNLSGNVFKISASGVSSSEGVDFIRYLNPKIKTIRLYDRALNQTEVSDNYQFDQMYYQITI